ncbi:disks large-associated protein 4-like [Ptychodera flava]|uniref:disks large-associated protein 4-like n=1 Tax=Ptychodera flava TaxID=63121 RepID=UPI00396A888D
MVMIQVDDVNRMFDEINVLKQNGWKLPTQRNPMKSKQSKMTRKPMRVSNNDKSVAKNTTTGDKAKQAREEARKRLLAAKKAAATQKLQNTENDVQIFIHTDDK